MNDALETIKAIDKANEEALRIKEAIDAERAAQAERSKQRMGLDRTLHIPGKANPRHTNMDKKYRAVLYVRDEEK